MPYAKAAGDVAKSVTPDSVKQAANWAGRQWKGAEQDIPFVTDVLGTAAMYNPESLMNAAGQAVSAAGKGAGWVAKNAEHFPYDLGLNQKAYIVPPGPGKSASPSGLEHSFNNDLKPVADSINQNGAFQRWNTSSGIPAASPMYRKPIPVVHATSADFTTPDMSRMDWGYHVGSPNAANMRVEDPGAYGPSYAPNSQPLYINTKNPVRMTDSNGAWQSDRMADDLVKHGTITPEEAAHVQAAYDFDNETPMPMQEQAARQRLIDLLKQKGYDSVVYQNRFEGIPDEEWRKGLAARGLEPKQAHLSEVSHLKQEMRKHMSDAEFKAAFPSVQDSYMLWDPGMVKGRFNRGTWDPKDPNRMKAKGGLIRKYEIASR